MAELLAFLIDVLVYHFIPRFWWILSPGSNSTAYSFPPIYRAKKQNCSI